MISLHPCERNPTRSPPPTKRKPLFRWHQIEIDVRVEGAEQPRLHLVKSHCSPEISALFSWIFTPNSQQKALQGPLARNDFLAVLDRYIKSKMHQREDIMHNRQPLISSSSSACRSGRSNAEGSNCLSANAFKFTKPNYGRTCCPLQFHEYYCTLLLLPFSSWSVIKQKKKK